MRHRPGARKPTPWRGLSELALRGLSHPPLPIAMLQAWRRPSHPFLPDGSLGRPMRPGNPGQAKVRTRRGGSPRQGCRDSGQERRAWDSNPRDGCPPSGFQDRRTRPLCEPSPGRPSRSSPTSHRRRAHSPRPERLTDQRPPAPDHPKSEGQGTPASGQASRAAIIVTPASPRNRLEDPA